MTKTTSLLGIIITILVGIYLYMKLCSSCIASAAGTDQIEQSEVKGPEILQSTRYPFAFSDGDFDYKEINNFNFKVSSSAIITPISKDLNDGVISLKLFLSENSKKHVNILGYYSSIENNNTAFPNVGIARATAIKNYFVDNGIPSMQINTMGKINEELIPEENIFYGPATYDIIEQNAESENELISLYERITKNPLVLYFDTGEAAINLSLQQRQKVADISRYLDKVEGANAKVVGHTDNDGSRSSNITLGQERADFAKAYLVRNGIPKSKITSSSKGQDSPIESNTTEEGRTKNRRTVVTLNK